MPSEVAVRVRGVSKSFALPGAAGPSLRRRLRGAPEGGARRIRALDRVSFDVGRGENFGIIGANGAGKSTLLRVICGILRPDAGEVKVRGKLSSVLSLGAGLKADFTGRENVFLMGAVAGMRRAEVSERFEAIAAFAGLGELIDQPLKTYSNGMRARLAFAVAFSLEPQILVVDEVLAVGDDEFRRKCAARLAPFLRGGATVIFASHAPAAIEHCDRVLLLDRGESLAIAEPRAVLEGYGQLSAAPGAARMAIRERIARCNGLGRREASTGGADESVATDALDLEGLGVFDATGRKVERLAPRATYQYRLRARFPCDATQIRATIVFKTFDGVEVAGVTTEPDDRCLRARAGADLHLSLPFDNRLVPGTYTVAARIAARREGGEPLVHVGNDLDVFEVGVEGHSGAIGLVDLSPGRSS